MKTKKIIYSFFFIFLIVFINCTKEVEKEEQEQQEDQEILICEFYDLGVTKLDTIAIFNYSPSKWEAKYSDGKVEIFYNYSRGIHGELSTAVFKFDKVNNCLKFTKAYDLFQHQPIPLAVRKISVETLQLQTWNEDKLISGKVTFKYTNNPQYEYSKKFWIKMDINDYYTDQNETPLNFNNCINNQIPKEIDVNKDGINDFLLDYKVTNYTNYTPEYKTYQLQVTPLNNDNTLLEHNDDSRPYTPKTFFLSPFNSNQNTFVVTSHEHSLATFKEYKGYFARYNTWTTLYDNREEVYRIYRMDGYLVVKMRLNNLDYYGWIKIDFDTRNCSFNIIDSYLNPVPNEHVSVN